MDKQMTAIDTAMNHLVDAWTLRNATLSAQPAEEKA